MYPSRYDDRTRERLINHIRYKSVICKHNIILRGFACTEEEATTIDESLRIVHKQLQSRGRRRHFVDEPVIGLVGPLLPILIPDGVRLSNHHVLGFGHNHH